jgi:non-canonical (house-cleaning) NTP pyrophosphatase
VSDDGEKMECFAWTAVYNGKNMGTARTASFFLPKQIRDLVLEGMELGDADDKVFGTVNAKQGDGTVGHLTKGIINRTQYYAPAVVLAFVPFMWPDLYPTATTSVDLLSRSI